MLYYDSSRILNSIERTFRTLTNAGGNDTFLAKYDSSGTGVWATRIVGSGSDTPVNMVIGK